jgi:L-histidine N-alpha-methyltransferase
MQATVEQLAVADDERGMRQAMAEEVRRGLVRRPRYVASKYLYDARGCQLFDEITRLPEYYLTRAETVILREQGDDIALRTLPKAIIELGAGYSTKTRLLIASAMGAGSLEYFVPTDISRTAVETVAHALPREFPGLRVHGVVVEFEDVAEVPRFGRQLVIFLGSTIGNLNGKARAQFLRRIRRMMHADDWFLLGVDLVKDKRVIDAAYNDSEGVTAQFTNNLLRVLNRELGADFDPFGFSHVAAYHPGRRRVEIYLRSLMQQTVRIPACDLRIDFTRGELVQTEISVKFERKSLTRELRAAGLRLQEWFTDPAERFALALASPVFF